MPVATIAPVVEDASADVSLPDRIANAVQSWSTSQIELVMLAAELCDSPVWILEGSPTAAHYLATIADVEPATARDWIRVGKRVRELPVIGQLFEDGILSYSKVRALIAVATPDNETELAALAIDVPAGELRKVLAIWLKDNNDPEALADYQRRQRSVKWRNEPDGMILFTLRLQPHIAAVLIALLSTFVMRSRPKPHPTDGWPTVAQQHADAVEALVTDGAGDINTEVVFHVRSDGATCDDGTPITDTTIADLLPHSFIRALIHDADSKPINASGRQRHPTARQKRVVKERDRVCVDCGRNTLLEYDHVPAYEETGRTLVDDLELRCAPCHHKRHA